MEFDKIPDHFSDAEDMELGDIADPDEVVARDKYGEYLQPIIEDIVAYAEARHVAVPQLIMEINNMSDKDRYAFAWWIGETKYQLQIWHGEVKMELARQMPQR